jgi:hypothetical protein
LLFRHVQIAGRSSQISAHISRAPQPARVIAIPEVSFAVEAIDFAGVLETSAFAKSPLFELQ